MMAHMQERRLTDRLKVTEDMFVSVNNCLCKVHDISLDGVAFDYAGDAAPLLRTSNTLEIFFMSGPILYIENIPYTIVADFPVPNEDNDSRRMQRRVCTRFDDLNFRQIISFNHLMHNPL